MTLSTDSLATQYPVMLRYATPADDSLIYSSWLKSYKQSPVNKRIKAQQYYAYQKRIIERLLARSHAVCVCNPDDQDQVYSFGVVEIHDDKMVLHWVQTKYTFKHLGFARMIVEQGLAQVPSLKLYCTHLPANDFFTHLQNKYGAILDPALKE